MELGGSGFPALTKAWPLIGAEHMNGWVERAKSGIGDPVADLASVMLTVIEEQACVIAQLIKRVDALSS